MEITSQADFKAKLGEFMDRVEHQHERLTITRNGRPSVIVVAVDEWEAIEETAFWRSVPGIREELGVAQAEHERGESISIEDYAASRGLALRPRP